MLSLYKKGLIPEAQVLEWERRTGINPLADAKRERFWGDIKRYSSLGFALGLFFILKEWPKSWLHISALAWLGFVLMAINLFFTFFSPHRSGNHIIGVEGRNFAKSLGPPDDYEM